MAGSAARRLQVHPGARAARASDLPASLTRFVGRSAELDELGRLLQETRSLTLTGPGGSGKTRLALELVRRVGREPARSVGWVELASLQDAALLPQQVATSVGVLDRAGRDAEEGLVLALGERPTLLVLDNCEHLVAACARLVDRLLRACPELRVLATSREALGVAGEVAWPVPPLSLPVPAAAAPSAAALQRSEAAALFLDRARAAMPAFRLSDANAAAVAAICRRLDGVPLALELAAARLNVLSPAQLLARLDDCFTILVSRSRSSLPRHATIRATIDWSHDLLSAPEQLLLQRLSVFAGGFSLEAAEGVCADAQIEAGAVLDLLAGLVERSLVVARAHAEALRYELLEVVRQYAAERLEAGGERRTFEQRHAAYYAAFAAELAPAVDLLQEPAQLDRMTADHDNLRAAMQRALAEGAAEPALRIAAAFGPVANYTMQWVEGRRWLDAALAAAGPPQPTPLFAAALQAAGTLAGTMQEHAQAVAWLDDAVRSARALDDRRTLALALASLAAESMQVGARELALARAQESVQQARAAGDPYVLCYVLATGLGFVHAYRGEPELADGVCAEAQSLALALDHALGILFTSFSRAMIAWLREDYDAAEQHSLATVEPLRRLGGRWYAGRALFVPGAVALHRGDAAQATRLLAACATQYRLAGGDLVAIERPLFDTLIERARAALGEQAFASAWAEGAAWTASHALAQVGAGPVGASTAAGAAALRSHAEAEAPPVTVLPAAADEPAAPRLAPAAELVVRALGPLEIVLTGEPLAAERWAYAKPRELLLYLLCRARGATKEEIGAALWPNASPAQLRNNLHVTLHYLRKTLGGTDWIAYAEERYRVGPAHSVWFDAAEFAQRMALALRDRSAPDLPVLEETLRLYRGDLLHEERFGAWHLPYRDDALASYVDGLAALADHTFGRGEYGDAARLYRAVIARNELREDAQRRLMQCLARTGDRAGALRHFQRLELVLREELTTEPDPETATFAEALRAGRSI